jgi:hypothetical protein
MPSSSSLHTNNCACLYSLLSAAVAVAVAVAAAAEHIISVLTEQLCCVQEGARGQGPPGEKQLEAIINIYKQTQVLQ